MRLARIYPNVCLLIVTDKAGLLNLTLRLFKF